MASGAVNSGHVASGAVIGSVGGGAFTIASGTIGPNDLGSGSVGSGAIASGQVTNLKLGSGSVTSGTIASGQVGQFHIASGSVTSGRLGVAGTPTGALFLRDDFTWVAPGGASITSGSVGSGAVASGTVQGFFGTTRHIASGTIGVDDFGSGAVTAGTVGSGAIASGNVASGQIADFHFASGAHIDAASYNFTVFNTLHMISGVRAVALNTNTSGATGVRIAQPDAPLSILSGNFMPAIGVVLDNVDSGQPARVYHHGPIYSSGFIGISGGTQQDQDSLIVLRSGLVGTGRVKDFTSGFIQQLGWSFNRSGVFLEVRAQGSGMLHANSIQSGDVVLDVNRVIDNAAPAGFGGFIAAEPISGVRAVTYRLRPGGFVAPLIIMAQAAMSGRMPAVGILTGNYNSGDEIVQFSGSPNPGIIMFGRASLVTSGFIGSTQPYSGAAWSGAVIGQPLFVGNSGELSRIAPSASGSMIQPLGIVAGINDAATGAVGELSVGYRPASGDISWLRLGSGAILSGHVGSGQIITQNIASGADIDFANAIVDNDHYSVCDDLSSGLAWVYASGFDGAGRALVGRCNPYDPNKMPAIGAVIDTVSGAVASVIIAGFLRTPRLQLQFGAPTGPFALYIGSGGAASTLNIVGNTSGAIVQQCGVMLPNNGQASGIMFVNTIPVGVGDILQSRLGAASVGGAQIQSGAINGVFHILSGSVGWQNLGSGSVLSGQLGSGQVSTNHIALSASIYLSIITEKVTISGRAANAISGDISPDVPGGGKAITIAAVRIASGGNSGTVLFERILPAGGAAFPQHAGVITQNTFSGDLVNVITHGIVRNVWAHGGRAGDFLYITRSGGLAPIFSGNDPNGFGGGTFVAGAELDYPPDPVGLILSTSGANVGSGYSDVLVFPPSMMLSGAANFTSLGLNAVQSGNIRSGTIGHIHIRAQGILSGDLGAASVVGNAFLVNSMVASGSLGANDIGIGQIGSGHIFADAVVSGKIGSGNIITYSRVVAEDSYVTQETISGVRAVQINRSGFLRIAMAAVSGRMPANGVAFGNALSGGALLFVVTGKNVGPAAEIGSGLCISGRMGSRLWVGASGQLVTISGGGPTIGVGITNSGAQGQLIGIVASSGAVYINTDPPFLLSGAAVITTNTQFWPL
jgi:hypothetical protein